MFGVIWFHTVKSQAQNDFWDTCYKLFFSLFFCIILTVLYTVVNYPNTLFTRSFLARSVHKSNKIYNKIQNIWFPLPTYSVLQLPKQCLRKYMVLLNFCLCVYIPTFLFVIHDCISLVHVYRMFFANNWGNRNQLLNKLCFQTLTIKYFVNVRSIIYLNRPVSVSS